MITNRNGNESLFLSLIKEGFFEIDENGYIWKTYDGRSKGNKSKNIRRAEFIDDRGYLVIFISINKKRYFCKAHRLVYAYFKNELVGDKEINHIDGNKTNNNISNLELSDRFHNMQHAYKLGLLKSNIGSKNGYSKLTEEQVLEIRRLRNEGIMVRELSEMFNISKTNIRDIISRKLWKHI